MDALYLPGLGAVLSAFIDANRCLEVDGMTGRTVCGVQNCCLREHLLAYLQRIGLALAAVAGVALGFLMSMLEPQHGRRPTAGRPLLGAAAATASMLFGVRLAVAIACIIVIGLVAVALGGCIRWLGDRLVPWHGKV